MADGSKQLRILVTGGLGFIGSHLCERLVEQGHQVVCLDDLSTGCPANVAPLTGRGNFSLIVQDVAEPIDVIADQIYNLAAPASPSHYQADPIRTFRTCVMGAMNVLELAKRLNVPVLQASTSEVYGDPDIHPQVEGYSGYVNPIGPRACYDEGKRGAETLFSDYRRMYGVKAKIARLFNTYGPRMREDDGRVISNFLFQAIDGKPLTIYGGGHQTRSFCYIDDVVRGLIALMNCDADEGIPVNLGNPEEVSIATLAQEIVAMTGTKSPIVDRPLPEDDPRRRCPDISRAKNLLGWQPQVTRADGLARMFEYLTADLAVAV